MCLIVLEEILLHAHLRIITAIEAENIERA